MLSQEFTTTNTGAAPATTASAAPPPPFNVHAPTVAITGLAPTDTSVTFTLNATAVAASVTYVVVQGGQVYSATDNSFDIASCLANTSDVPHSSIIACKVVLASTGSPATVTVTGEPRPAQRLCVAQGTGSLGPTLTSPPLRVLQASTPGPRTPSGLCHRTLALRDRSASPRPTRPPPRASTPETQRRRASPPRRARPRPLRARLPRLRRRLLRPAPRPRPPARRPPARLPSGLARRS